jgi:hypothetical protein
MKDLIQSPNIARLCPPSGKTKCITNRGEMLLRRRKPQQNQKASKSQEVSQEWRRKKE